MSEPLLTVQRLSTGYGDIRALWDVGIEVWPGQVTVVLGHNGAGKTTLLSAIAGLLPVSAGTIHQGDTLLNHHSPERRSRGGLALVQEGKRIFRRLSVEDNLVLGGAALKRKELAGRVELAYDRYPILKEKRRQMAGSLSGGQQQMLAIAQAMMPKPKVLMLDEPSAGLAPIIFEEVLSAVSRLKEEGVGILLVEQLVDKVTGLADHTVHLSNGRVSD